MTSLAVASSKLTSLVLYAFVRGNIMAKSKNPFHPTCGGMKPFRHSFITVVNWGLGIVDTVAGGYVLYLLVMWMFSSQKEHGKRIAILIIGLILVNGAAFKYLGAFGIGQNCL